MISQNCPKCSSSRIRPGYRPTPIWSKLLFRYNLLCDSCNWEFKGFAVPGTVTRKKPKKTRSSIDNSNKSDGSVEKSSSHEIEKEPVDQLEDQNETIKIIFEQVEDKKSKKTGVQKHKEKL